MSRLLCSYEKNPGHLTIARKGFVFSGSTFTIKIRWKDVKNMTSGTRWENGKTNARIYVELLNEQTPKPNGDVKEGSVFTSKRVFQFSDFHDFLGASDNLIRSWKAYQKPAERDESREVAAPADQGNEKAEKLNASNGWVWKHCGCMAQRFSSIVPSKKFFRDALNFVFGMNLLFLAAALVVSLIILAGFLPKRHKEPFKDTEALFSSLDSVRHRLSNLQHSDVREYHRSGRQRRELIGSSESWARKLQLSAAELSKSYVFLQLKLCELRQRRADRLFRSNELTQQVSSSSVSVSSASLYEKSEWTGSDMSAEWGSLDSMQRFSRKPSNRLSFRRIGYEMSRLTRFIFTMGRNLSPWRRLRTGCSRLQGSLAAPQTRYEEVLGNQALSQLVTQEDGEERNECLHLISELVQVAELAEETFSQFIGVLMNRVLDDLSTGRYTPHQWSPIPSGISVDNDGVCKEEAIFDVEVVLKVIWMRKHLDALMRQDPLEPNDQHRHEESLEYAKLRQRFITLENHLSHRRNATQRDHLLAAFYKSIVLRSDKGRKDSLRNIIDEVLFWNAHEELWSEHVSRTLEKTKTSGVINVLPPWQSSSTHLHWDHLPVFRGLLCFSDSPRLMRGTADVSSLPHYSSGVVSSSSKRPATGISDEYRLLHVEATAFQQMNEDIMERWINDLQLFLEALVDTSSKANRMGFATPHYAGSPILRTRARLINIIRKAKDMKMGLFSSFRFKRDTSEERGIKSMGSADPALQSAYTRVTGLPWDNMHDMPYSIFNNIFLQPSDLVAQKISIRRLLRLSIGGIIISLAGFTAFKILM